MIYSMTGFGKGETQSDTLGINVEIRTLNSKSLDLNLRTHNSLREIEPLLRKKISNSLSRGKIDVSIYLDFQGEQAPAKINQGVVKSYLAQLETISETPVEQLLPIAMRLPETLSNENKTLEKSTQNALFELLDEVLLKVNDFRAEEGKALAVDLKHRQSNLTKLLVEVKRLDPERAILIKEKLQKALSEMTSEIDENRLEQELIYYVEKYDITEEKVRLKKHLAYFEEVLQNDFPNGKKLGFISQEMGREINTIGSKANHAALQKVVVQMKDELEKIKEQLLNVL